MPTTEPVNTTPQDATEAAELLSALLEEGKSFVAEGKNLDAAERFRQMTLIAPDNTTGWNNLGVALHNLRKWDEAMAAFSRALSLDPADNNIRHNLRTLLMSTDDSGRMDSEIAVKYGEALHRAGRIADAYEQFVIAIENDPQSAEAWNDLGVVVFMAGQLDKAEEAFRKSLSLSADDTNTLNNFARLLLAQGKDAEAYDVLSQTLQLDPGNETARGELIPLGIVRATDTIMNAENAQILQMVETIRSYGPRRLAEIGWTLTENTKRFAE